jgi:hypothetical protein
LLAIKSLKANKNLTLPIVNNIYEGNVKKNLELENKINP